MEKQIKSSDERKIGYGSAYVIGGESPDHLVGRLLTIIDAIGLSEKQEKSLKDLIRFEVYNSLNLATWIPSSLHNVIVDMYEWYQKESLRLNKARRAGSSDRATQRGHKPVDHTMQGEFTLNYEEQE
ncbi:hypothetical protein KAU11_10330 [Candidatus Babeliales bacterium]|nr:hypothetical protein [Candidatus Babeliales bacterium]